MSSRQEQKAAARAAREQAQQETAEAQRRRRLFQLGGAIAVAAIVAVVIVIAASGGGSSDKADKGGPSTGAGAAAYQLLGGIPDKRLILGKADAPVTLVEFNDMQCPVCKQYSDAVFPTLVRNYVRSGKVRMEMRLQSFIGPDSIKGGKAVAAAGLQDKGWLFSDIFYREQGEENTGYVTDDFLRRIAKETPGLDTAKLFKDMRTPAAAQALKTGESEFNARGFDGTPSFLVGKTGGPLTVLRWTQLTPEQFTKPIDRLLGS